MALRYPDQLWGQPNFLRLSEPLSCSGAGWQRDPVALWPFHTPSSSIGNGEQSKKTLCASVRSSCSASGLALFFGDGGLLSGVCHGPTCRYSLQFLLWLDTHTWFQSVWEEGTWQWWQADDSYKAAATVGLAEWTPNAGKTSLLV